MQAFRAAPGQADSRRGWLTEAELTYCDKAGEGDEAALIDALCHCKNGKEFGRRTGVLQPGGGGTRRSWRRRTARRDELGSREVNKEGAAFKEKVLQPAAAASLKKSRLGRRQRGRPHVDKIRRRLRQRRVGNGSGRRRQGAARRLSSPGIRKNDSALLGPRDTNDNDPRRRRCSCRPRNSARRRSGQPGVGRNGPRPAGPSQLHRMVWRAS